MNIVDKQCIDTVWLTPESILQRVRVYYDGAIDLDPATELDNPTGANTFRTTDGLEYSWCQHTNVFINPPYGVELKHWTAKIAFESRAGAHIIALLPGQRFETGYWQQDILNERLTAVCFVRRRVGFLNSQRERRTSNPYGSMLYVYNGDAVKAGEVFSALGKVYQLNLLEPVGGTGQRENMPTANTQEETGE